MKTTGSKVFNNLAYISGILMIIGLHLPLYVASKGSTVELIYRTNNEGIFLLISALLVIIQRYNKRNKYFLISLFFQIGMVVYYILLMRSDEKFLTLSLGFVCEIISIIVLFFAFLTKNGKEVETVNDISTMHVIKTDEYEYCDKVGVRDFSWIIVVIVLSTLVVMLKLNMDKRSETITSDLSSKYVKALENEESNVTNYDYENDNYSVNIEDGYITNEDGQEIVFIEITMKNKTQEKLVFNEQFEIVAMQGNKELKRCTKVDSDIFDSNSSLAQISLLETSKVYLPFILEDSQKNLKVSLNAIVINNDVMTSENIIKDKVVKINNMYYVDTLEEIITIAERKMDEEDKSKNKNDDNEIVLEIVKTTSSPEATDTISTVEPTKVEGQIDSETTKEPEAEETKEPKPTEEGNENLLSGTVKFERPTDWSEESKVYIYIYEKEEDVVEKTRIVNSDYSNNEYTFFLTDINMAENVYITFGNDTKMHPENNKKLVLAMGKKYTIN